MPSRSRLQARFMAACAHGAGYGSCPPAKVSAEFNRADAGTGILKRAAGGSVKYLDPDREAYEASAQYEASRYAESKDNERRKGRDLADGGTAVPWFIKREATEIYHPSGFLHSTGAGRADTLPRAVGAESHVIPADVVAGLGDGNSLAGAAVMNKILSTGPFGTPLRRHRADGGGVEPEKVPVQLSGGEYVVSPDQVQQWGGGDVGKGHRAIDKFILSVRKHSIAKMKKLPPPKR